MSLQVWLPLIKDYQNYGLHTMQFSLASSTTSQQSNGKIGPTCYYNDSYTSGGLISNQTIDLGTNLSMFCWMNFSSVYSSSSLMAVGGQHRYPANTGMGITIKYNNSTSGYLSLNTGNGSNRTYNTYCGSTLLTAGTWYHVGFTYDGSTIKLYVNGKLDGTHSYSGQKNIEDYIAIFNWSFNSGSVDQSLHGNYKFHGYLNDFRIYDHTLSAKEVKEISKGLRLHYQLKAPRMTNLAPSTFNVYNNFGVAANIVNMLGETFMGYPIYRLTMTVPSDTTQLNSFKGELWSHGVYQANMDFAANTKYCYWLYYRPVTHSDIRVGGVASNIGGWTEIAPHYFGDGWYRVGQYRDGTVTSTKNDHPYTSFFSPSAAAGQKISIDFCCPNLVAGVSEIIESYGAIESRGTETDVSGYGNHATIAGTISANPDTPRYKNSYYFNSGSYIATPAQSYDGMANSYTFSYWAKISNMDGKMVWGFSNGNRLNVYPSSWFNWNTGNGAENPFMSGGSNVAFTSYNGAWHHYAITGNGSTTTLYIDGVARGTAKTYQPITGTQIIISGWNTANDYKWNGGQISDYRLYATCFSAEDVAELYNTGASIAKDGTLFAYEFNGFSSDKKSSINKDGIALTNGMNDRALPLYDMKIKGLDDGSVWARIHHLNVLNEASYFASAAEVQKCIDKPNRYSRMGIVDKFKSSPGAGLPAGYTELEYIESNGTQYIDSGVSIGANVWVDIDLMWTSAFSYNMMLGAWSVLALSLRDTNVVCAASGGAETQNIGSTTAANVKYNIKLGADKGYTQNGTKYSLGASSNRATGRHILIFAASNSENNPYAWGSYGVGRIYSMRIYDGNQMVRNFVPCKNPAGTLGLYDLVENKFYSNAGSGAFTSGAFVSKYEFMLTYPNLGLTLGTSEKYNRWTQTSSPNATSVTDYTPISISWSAHSAGIRKHGSACLYNCDSGSTWYAPIGQYSAWEGGIPAANGEMATETELWVRIDKSAYATGANIYDGSIVATNFIEI